MSDYTFDVLLLEDNPTDTLLMREILEGSLSPQFDIAAVESLGEALRRLETHTFDVALVDLGLADSEGLETCRQIHAHAPSLPIVILTISSDYEDALKEVFDAGAQDYLVKGKIDSSGLVRSVRYAIERMRVNQELIQVEQELCQAKKMETIGTLTGGIAHEFNNILAIMIGYADFAANALPKDSSTYENLQDVLTAGARAKELVRQLMISSHQLELDRAPLILQQTIADSLTWLRALMPATITLREHLDAHGRGILADATRIRQIMIHLCGNATHAMRATGGVLEVRLDEFVVTDDVVAIHPELKPGPHVRLTIKDTGTGMAPEVRERIFDPFFTTKNIGEGTGMGLPVVRGIMLSYGGAITVESRSQHGTTVTLYFPLEEFGERKDGAEGGI
jgi:signal transduction histidine kinase